MARIKKTLKKLLYVYDYLCFDLIQICLLDGHFVVYFCVMAIALHEKPISELRSVTRRMGSHTQHR